MRAKGGPQRKTEGKSRNLSRKRQHQPKKQYWPKPHYPGLRRQVRNMIRPFRWIPLPDGMDANETFLPSEVRNMIYCFAIRPDCSATGYVGRGRILLRCDHNSDAIYEENRKGYGAPDFSIMNLSKAIRREAASYFYRKYHIELIVMLDQGVIRPTLTAAFHHRFDVEHFEDARILLSFCGQCLGMGDKSIDLSNLTTALPKLKTLRISMRTRGMPKKNMQVSAVVVGLVTQILDSIPADIDIIWEVWTGAEVIHSCGGWRNLDAEGNSYPTIDIDWLDVLAAKWR